MTVSNNSNQTQSLCVYKLSFPHAKSHSTPGGCAQQVKSAKSQNLSVFDRRLTNIEKDNSRQIICMQYLFLSDAQSHCLFSAWKNDNINKSTFHEGCCEARREMVLWRLSENDTCLSANYASRGTTYSMFNSTFKELSSIKVQVIYALRVVQTIWFYDYRRFTVHIHNGTHFQKPKKKDYFSKFLCSKPRKLLKTTATSDGTLVISNEGKFYNNKKANAQTIIK